MTERLVFIDCRGLRTGAVFSFTSSTAKRHKIVCGLRADGTTEALVKKREHKTMKLEGLGEVYEMGC
jgi:hypothetical protein